MEKSLLTICIPVYNNYKGLKRLLLSIALSNFNGRTVEISVSDNNSNDNVEEVVRWFKKNYQSISFNYSKSSKNIGLAKNYLRVVAMAKTEFAWIIGADDLIANNAIDEIYSIIYCDPSIDFLVINHASYQTDVFNCNEPIDFSSLNELVYSNPHSKNSSQFLADYYDWEMLLKPSFGNIMLGSMMVNIFRKSLWDKVNIDKSHINDETIDFISTYPHVYIFGQSMRDSVAYYTNKVLVYVGLGSTTWAGKSFWIGYKPIFYLKVFLEFVEYFQSIKIRSDVLKDVKKFVAYHNGYYLSFFFKSKFLMRNLYIKHFQLISIAKIFKKNSLIPRFYYGLLRGIFAGDKI